MSWIVLVVPRPPTPIPAVETYTGPETTTTWSDLMRESKIPETVGVDARQYPEDHMTTRRSLYD